MSNFKIDKLISSILNQINQIQSQIENVSQENLSQKEKVQLTYLMNLLFEIYVLSHGVEEPSDLQIELKRIKENLLKFEEENQNENLKENIKENIKENKKIRNKKKRKKDFKQN